MSYIISLFNMLLSYQFLRVIFLSTKSWRNILIKKERIAQEYVRLILSLVMYQVHACVMYVHNVDLCLSLPAGDLEKGMPIFPLHKREYRCHANGE